MPKGKIGATSCFLLVLCCVHESLWAQLSITTANVAYTQNFDGLSSLGSDIDATATMFSNGWSFLESGTSTNNNQKYSAGTGSSTTGDTYSFGVAGTNPATDRAFGILQTGTLSSVLGFKFTNNTGQTLVSLVVSYSGEVWRSNSPVDQLSFSYQVGDIPLNAASGWTVVSGL